MGRGFTHDGVKVVPYKERVQSVEAGPFKWIYDAAVGKPVAWHVNDHTIIQGPDGTWHMFGIAFPESGGPVEEALAHATASSLDGPYATQEPVLIADASYGETHLWAPHVLLHEGTYYMFYAGGGEDHTKAIMCLATSTDLWHWEREPSGALFADGWEARDPMVMRHGDQWIMYYCATENRSYSRHTVEYRTSTDLVHWSDRQTAYEAPQYGDGAGDTESPFVIEHDGAFYLFVGPVGAYEGGYNSYNSTDVIRSDDPLHFDREQRVGRIRAHAPEVIRHDGKWFITHSGVGQNGLYLAELHLDRIQTRSGVRASGSSYEVDIQSSPECGIVALRTPDGENLVDDGYRGTGPYLGIGGYGDSPRRGAADRVALDRKKGSVTFRGITFGRESVTADWTISFATDWFDSTMTWDLADELSGVVMEGGWSLNSALAHVGDEADPDRAPGTSAGGLGQYVIASDANSATIVAAYLEDSMWAEYNRWYNSKVGTISMQFIMKWAGLRWVPGQYEGGTWRIGVSSKGTDTALADRLVEGVNG